MMRTERGFFRQVTGAVGKRARRIYFLFILLLLLVTSIARLRSYLMARKIETVLRGLSELQIDQTTEEQLKKSVPLLSKVNWQFRGKQTVYRFRISIESDPRILILAAYGLDWSGHLADWIGYRFMSFDATVLLDDGKVTHVEYGLANRWIRPEYPGYAGYIVSARSAHSFWMPRMESFPVSSTDDESPKYRPRGDAHGLFVIYTNDAPANLTRHAFHLQFSCFWRLRGCDDAREIAPAIWHDEQEIQHATYEQLISEKCPDSIIDGRMRYLPDVLVLRLEVTGSRRMQVNEEGTPIEDWFTDYKLKEVIRGHASGTWKNVRFRRTIPSPENPTQIIANQIWPPTKVGTQVLYFGNLYFYSCRFIPATATGLEIVRRTQLPDKRPEDEIPMGLQ